MKHHERSLLAQLRYGILPIHVETGRYVDDDDDVAAAVVVVDDDDVIVV